jgi:hypothetical protein
VFLGELSGIVYAIRQKTRLRIVEFVPKTPLEELTNHCEGEHADVCERLACLSPEQLDEMDQRLKSSGTNPSR